MHMLHTGLLPERPTKSTEADNPLETHSGEEEGIDSPLKLYIGDPDSAVAISPPSRPSKRYRLGS